MTTIEDKIRDLVLDSMPTEKDIFGFINHLYWPEDVFKKETLETWAKENGYIKGEA